MPEISIHLPSILDLSQLRSPGGCHHWRVPKGLSVSDFGGMNSPFTETGHTPSCLSGTEWCVLSHRSTTSPVSQRGPYRPIHAARPKPTQPPTPRACPRQESKGSDCSSKSQPDKQYLRDRLKLMERGVVRTLNAPQGDYAEALVAQAYGGSLAPKSKKSWDVGHAWWAEAPSQVAGCHRRLTA